MSFSQELRFSVRRVSKRPVFAITVILILTLSIGANTAVFSILNALMLRPLPYPQPERIGSILRHTAANGEVDDDNSIDGTAWELIRQYVPGAVAAISSDLSGVNLQSKAGVQYVKGLRVSAHYFEVLGIQPMLGRAFTEEEDLPGGPKAVLLSNALWKHRFGSDPHVIGASVLVKGEPHTVVGVLPPESNSPQHADLWTPIKPSTTGEGGGDNYLPILRLRPGVSWGQVLTQLKSIPIPDGAELRKQYPGAERYFYAVPLQKGLGLEQRNPALALMLAVGFILLIACSNLAALMLVRVSEQSSELATRLALGASRWLIIRQLWLENMMLGLCGAVSGCALAYLLGEALTKVIPAEYMPTGGISVDVRVLAFALAAGLFTSLLFGLLPALQVRRFSLRSAIESSGNRSVTSGSGTGLRQALIVGELGLTVVLLTAAGLLIHTLIYLETLPPGFDATHVVGAKFSLDDARYHDPAKFQSLLQRTVTGMQEIPGVESAAAGLSVPYERGLNDGFQVSDGKQAGERSGTSMTYVTPAYFFVLRIPVLTGRSFSDSDTTVGQPVVIVNQAFAKKFLQEDNPVGRHVKAAGSDRLVVGVVTNVAKQPGMYRDQPLSTEPTIYLPSTQVDHAFLSISHIWFQPSWIVRTRNSAPDLQPKMQSVVTATDPNLPIASFYTMDEVRSEVLSFQRTEVALLTSLAGLAILLSALGVYGLTSNLVLQRTRELGIRNALGATVPQAMYSIGRSALATSCLGLALGVILSAVTVHAMKSQIYGIATYDPATFGLSLALLAVVAVGSTLVPVLRIVRIDPANVLRAE